MVYGLGDNTSGTNNTPLGARRRVMNTKDKYLSEGENGKSVKIKMEKTETQMEIRTKHEDIPLATLMDESDDEPRIKRGRSVQRGL